MPQATEELRAEMKRLFGDPISDEGPTKYLESHGYLLTPGWEWYKPGVLDPSAMTEDEWLCLLFLVQEWDFGGLTISP